MKCPKCGNSLPAMTPASDGGLHCARCGCALKEPTYPCQHEPANFCVAGPDNFTDITYPYLMPNMIAHTPPMRFLVCRLCGVFYTDLDAVAAGEKKYQEAQDDTQAAQRQKG